LSPESLDLRRTASAQPDKSFYERLRFRQILGYSIGGIPSSFALDGPKVLVGPIYNIVLGINPASIGVVLMVTRLWDAMLDPLVGVLSDNCRSRWGRRVPFMAVGAVLSAITFPVIWLVSPQWSAGSALGYLAVTLLLFYSTATTFNIPWSAVALELTPNYSERTRLVAWRTVIAAPGALLIQWSFHLAQASIFPDALAGMRVVALLFSAAFILFGLAPCFFVTERFQDKVAAQPKRRTLAGIRDCLGSGPFRLLMGMTVLIIIGYQSFSALGIYVNTYYVFGGDPKPAARMAALGGTVIIASGCMLVPAVNWAARQWGKIAALKLCLAMGVVGGAARWFLYRPEWPYLQLIEPFLSYPAVAGFWILVTSMKADICDWDELQSGLRREGTFAAVSSWLQKFAGSTTFALTGMFLVAIGFEQGLGGRQSETTLQWMRLGFSVFPVIAFSLGIWLIGKFSLTPGKMQEIRSELERRRGVR
jgi:GPH family glycoside/pentoside/hexuronide:cation symporter